MLSSLAHQDLPFEKVVEAVAPSRDLSRNPLFQVAVNSVTAEQAGAFQLGDLRAQAVQVDPETTKYDVGLLVHESHERDTTLVLEYSVDLFDEATVAALADELMTLLRAGLASPDEPLAALDLTSPEQRTRVVETLNATAGAIPDGCVHDAMLAQAARTPDAVAVADEQGSLTYAELDARTNQLAHVLVRHGVGPGVLVAVGVPRSVAMEVAVVATLKAGGAYLPLDTTYPTERLAFMLADASAAVLVTDRAARGQLPDQLPPHMATVLVDELDDVLAGLPESAAAAPPNTGVTPDDLRLRDLHLGLDRPAQGRRSSRHRGIVNRLAWMQDAVRLDRGRPVLQKTPVSFDVSVWELFWPLMHGARVVLAAPGRAPRPARTCAELIGASGITTMHFVPSMLRGVPRSSTRHATARAAALACARCSAAARRCRVELARALRATLAGAGCTTSTAPPRPPIDVTWHAAGSGCRRRTCPSAARSGTRATLRARRARCDPVPGRRARRAVPRRRPAGPRLPRPSRPDRRALRARPVRRRPGRRLYRTGDLVRWRRRRRRSSTSAASTTRSSCAASGSSWARSRPS